MNKFVYTKNELDVGIVERSSKKSSLILFLRTSERKLIKNKELKKINLSTTGDRYENKICDRCYKYLPTDEFPNNRLKKNNIITKRPSCKDCRKLIDGKPISKEDRKKWEEDNRLSEGMIFECPICLKISIVGITKIVLDHNHSTGEIRGYLCESCNTGIGRFKDNVNILKNGIEWLS
tara:strand:+ start:124 stop:657 length:534 start_codon:yes stop_codon:yes gene_type:complete